jgi:hypothetical protein
MKEWNRTKDTDVLYKRLAMYRDKFNVLLHMKMNHDRVCPMVRAQARAAEFQANAPPPTDKPTIYLHPDTILRDEE